MRGFFSVALLGFLVAAPAAGSERPGAATARPGGPRELLAGFEPNRGQCAPDVRFLGRSGPTTALITATGAVFAVADRGERREAEGSSRLRDRAAPPLRPVSLEFLGASASPARAAVPLAGPSHYLLGRDPAAWVTGVPRFAAVLQPALWPGVDLRWDARGEGLEYSFRVRAGADPSRLAFRLGGHASVAVDAAGALVVATAGGGRLVHAAPRAWQEDGGARLPVEAAFDLRPGGVVGFRFGALRPGLPLVVDPVIAAGSWLGGTGQDYAYGVTVDASGAIFLAGSTASSNFPKVSAFDSTFTGSSEAFVAKVSAAGTSLLFSTYIGGNSDEFVQFVTVGGNGQAICGGRTGSSDFPMVAATQATRSGSQDGYVAELASNGASLSFSTYFGGTSTETVYSVAEDGSGNLLASGLTSSSTSFPLVSAFRSTYAGQEGFLARWTAARTLNFSSYLGGNSTDSVFAMVLDASGDAYVVGQTSSSDLPATLGYQKTIGGSSDAVVAKVAMGGPNLAWVSYLGGSVADAASAVAVSSSGRALVVGQTNSNNFPVSGPYQPTRKSLDSTNDAFATFFEPNGDVVSFSTFLGGNSNDFANECAIDAHGNFWLCGYTASGDFPVASALQANIRGTSDGFVAVLGPGGNTLPFSTFLGGSSTEESGSIKVSPWAGTVRVASYSASSDFPVASPFQAAIAGVNDATLTVMDCLPSPPADPTATANSPVAVNINWSDANFNETGFEIQHHAEGDPFVTVATPAKGATFFYDSGLADDTLYTYRIRALNPEGNSGWSVEFSARTQLAKPLAPTGAAAAAQSSSSILFSWNDNSHNETGFHVLRRTEGTGTAVLVHQTDAGTIQWTDEGREPDRSYGYSVRAVNSAGSSGTTVEVSAATLPTVDLVVTKGLVKDSTKLGADAVKVSGTFALNGTSPDGAFDPVAEGVVIGIYAPDRLLEFTVPAGDPTWTVKGTKATWKTPKTSLVKAKITVDTVAGTFAVALSKIQLPAVPLSPVRVRFGGGNDAGSRTDPWTPQKKGGLKF